MNGIFFFDPTDKIYADHFPGNPVVPGSLIVHAFMEASKKMGFSGKGYAIESFRFKHFISPGEYPFNIQVSSDGLRCELYQNDRTVVTGTLKI
jgi:3-hydroxyacyl-[acyl-carrier-protein] dehydratase